MNNFVLATLSFMIGFIVLTALLPVYSEIVAAMSFGTSVTLLISSAILLIVVGLIMNYVKDATTGGENYGY